MTSPRTSFWVDPAWVVLALLGLPVAASSQGTASQGTATQGTAPGPIERMDRLTRLADADRRAGELESAESRLRSAVHDGWMVLGKLAESRSFDEALDAYERAAAAILDPRPALEATATLYLHADEPDRAVVLLRELIAKRPDDLDLRRRLARALFAAGRGDEAVGELEEAAGARPDDPELAFTLATAYLRVDRDEDAETRFEQILRARPIPETHVLIGRTLRDFKRFEGARTHLDRALALEPDLPRARLYLGTLVLYSEGREPFETAVEYFRAELATLERLDRDPDQASTTHLFLGLTLLELRRFEEAIPHLQLAARDPDSARDALHNLGRSYLSLERVDEAVDTLEKALRLADDASHEQLTSIHYQLARALRRQGRPGEAQEHFDLAKQSSADLAQASRDRLRRYLEDRSEVEPRAKELVSGNDSAEFAGAVRRILARAHLNLGVLKTRQGRFETASRFLAQAVELDGDLPGAAYALGVARFNAGRFAEAVEPLEKARVVPGAGPEVHRMAALAYYNAERYGEAADLLAGDPELPTNPALQYTYAVALARSDRTAEAQQIFARLTAGGGEPWPELEAAVGRAHARDGNYPEAIVQLEKALGMRGDLPEAHASLGEIHLRQGNLEKAQAHLEAELRIRPDHVPTRFLLATVLDLRQDHDRAETELQRLLARRPDHADARYLLGKVLLTSGNAERALPHLEAAAGLRPESSVMRYQLAQAYQRLGRRDDASRAFERYRELKAAERSLP